MRGAVSIALAFKEVHFLFSQMITCEKALQNVARLNLFEYTEDGICCL